MTGVHIREAPGYHGWTRLKGRDWKTMNVAEIAECAAALAKDKADCLTCQSGEAGPIHATTWTHGDYPASGGHPGGRASAHSHRCPSGSRWFNPETRQMEGRKHCTCDYCY